MQSLQFLWLWIVAHRLGKSRRTESPSILYFPVCVAACVRGVLLTRIRVHRCALDVMNATAHRLQYVRTRIDYQSSTFATPLRIKNCVCVRGMPYTIYAIGGVERARECYVSVHFLLVIRTIFTWHVPSTSVIF